MDGFVEKNSPAALKYYRDLKNSLDTAKEERSIEIARKLLQEGDSLERIKRVTGLSDDQILNIKI